MKLQAGATPNIEKKLLYPKNIISSAIKKLKKHSANS